MLFFSYARGGVRLYFVVVVRSVGVILWRRRRRRRETSRARWVVTPATSPHTRSIIATAVLEMSPDWNSTPGTPTTAA